jgi:hypothetical protein
MICRWHRSFDLVELGEGSVEELQSEDEDGFVHALQSTRAAENEYDLSAALDELYDPRKPEYIVQVSPEERMADQETLLSHQVARLKTSLSRRRHANDESWEVTTHYEHVVADALAEMCSLQRQRTMSRPVLSEANAYEPCSTWALPSSDIPETMHSSRRSRLNLFEIDNIFPYCQVEVDNQILLSPAGRNNGAPSSNLADAPGFYDASSNQKPKVAETELLSNGPSSQRASFASTAPVTPVTSSSISSADWQSFDECERSCDSSLASNSEQSDGDLKPDVEPSFSKAIIVL